MYTPILRNRQSELRALQLLSELEKGLCFPLIDLAAPGKSADVHKVQTYVERNITRTEAAVAGFEYVLLDSSELDPNMRLRGLKYPLVEVAKAMVAAGTKPVPVVGLHREKSHMKAALKVAELVQSKRQFCVRLDATDVATSAHSFRELKSTLANLGVSSEKVILLLDLQSVFGTDPIFHSAKVGRFIAQVSDQDWAGFVIAGYGLPEQMSAAVEVRGQGYISRVEQTVFMQVASEFGSKKIWFGDYATLTPTQVELDWRVISKTMSPKVVYTLSDSWFVVRGGPFSTHSDGYGQYHDLASEIIALDEFSGSGFSYGDNYIQDCASRIGKTGSPSSWITACVNHHIALTGRQHE